MDIGKLKKKSLLHKTVQVGLMTFLSRMLGLVREVLQARYLGLTELSDAFIIAFKLPNSLRKIFAEGALSSAFIPTFVGLMQQHKRHEAEQLMSLSFLFFEGILIALCLLVFFFPAHVIYIFAPGFSPEQMVYATHYLKILIPFIVFVSSSALLAVALNAVHHFLIPAAGSIILNIGFIGALLLGIKYELPVDFLCYAILVSGLAVFGVHVAAYLYYQFSFPAISKEVLPYFKKLLVKFGPVCFCMSITEVNLALDTAFSSYLQAGTVSLINYAFRFMHIPLGVFGVAFSTILLPHFTRVISYSPKRLGFYLLEAMKFIFWISFPVIVFMSLFSAQIFTTTIGMSGKFPIQRLGEAQGLLVAFLAGLFFFSLNKIILNIYYAFHDTKIPTYVTLSATALNFMFNALFMYFFGSIGLALATTLSGVSQTWMLMMLLRYKYNFTLYFNHFFLFCRRYITQFVLLFIFFAGLYYGCLRLIMMLPMTLSTALVTKFYFWFWVGPLIGLFYLALLKTKKLFNVKMYFLD